MCGDSSRISRGGLLAVIHPVPNPSSTGRRHSLQNCRLHLSNDGYDRTLSQLDYDADPNVMEAEDQRLEVRIHESGQLSYSPQSSPRLTPFDQAAPSNPVMHSFYVSRVASANAEIPERSIMAAAQSQKLNLGVGGTGVVGRTVSVVDEHQVVVGEGIIGWN